VLNYIPNHYRALDAMARLGIKEKSAKPKGATYSIACYFDRAIRFVPDDGRVRLVQGIYLAKLGKLDEALVQYQEAEKTMPDSLNIAYNLGLLYFDMKKYDQSLEYAKKAYGGGITLPGLKNKLAGAGKWPANLVIVPKPPRAAKAAEPAAPGADDAAKTVQESPKTAQDTPAPAGEATPAPR
jgi:tetratricopeptide (TPR) repeat protein